MYFGWDTLVAELLANLDRRLTSGDIQMIMVPSGAGWLSFATGLADQ